MSTVRSVEVPFGLGWADRLAGVSLSGAETVRDRFNRRLFLGICGSSTVAFLGGAVQFVAVLHQIPSGICMVVGSLASLVCMVGLASSGKHFAGYVTAFLFGLTPLTPVTAISQGGSAGACQLVYAFMPPMLATLLLGRRAGLFWIAVPVIDLLLYGLWPRWVGPLPAPAPEMLSSDLGAALGTVASFGLLTLLILTWFVQQRDIAENLMETERARADALLLNVLPSSVVGRLKAGEPVADHVEEVSVLFADLVGFTAMASKLSARKLVQVLDGLFSEMDVLVTESGLEKIKTIGDCYMVAAGAPERREDHAAALVKLALQMGTLVATRDFSGHKLQLRMGIHSGPVVAGVIGTKRQVYDLWGDTVNTASRLESSGVPGRVHISDATRALLPASVKTESRGMTELKGKGAMETHLVSLT